MNRIDGNKAEDDAASSRKDLLRNVIVFQFKLFVDGIRDLILVPVSLVAAALDLASGAELASGNFARVLSLGRRSERYINLFGESEYPNQDPGSDAQSPGKRPVPPGRRLGRGRGSDECPAQGSQGRPGPV
jgi:hypothetical protein